MKDGLGSQKSWPSRVGKFFFLTSPFMDAVRFGHPPRATSEASEERAEH